MEVVVEVPGVLGKSFVDEKEASLCATAEGTVALPAPCLFLKTERVLGMSSYRCDLVGGVEFANRCRRAVKKERTELVGA